METLLAVVLLILAAFLAGAAEVIRSNRRRNKNRNTPLLGVVSPKNKKNSEF